MKICFIRDLPSLFMRKAYGILKKYFKVYAFHVPNNVIE